MVATLALAPGRRGGRGANLQGLCPLGIAMRNREVTGPDAIAGRVAAEQWGVITWAQLRASGLSKAAIGRRVRNERLHRIHVAVYAFMPATALAPEGRWLAAVLACGESAALSHRSAAALWDLLDSSPGWPEVTVPVGRAKDVEGVRLHRSRNLPKAITTRRGVPVTSLERTLADLADVVPQATLHRAAQQAEFLRRKLGPAGDPWRYANGRRGAPNLRTLPLLRGKVGMTRSELERRMLRLCRQAGLPEPECNAVIAGEHVDFVWRDARLIVETDGGDAHLTAAAFESDRRRDVELMVAGWRVARFTWAMVRAERSRIAARLAALLA
jgi:very-short-patch-repair endonuclease